MTKQFLPAATITAVEPKNCYGHNLYTLNLCCNRKVANNARMRSETLDDLLRAAVRRLPAPCDDNPAERTVAPVRAAVRLDDGGVWSGDPAPRASTLRCASGMLWITQAGHGDDVVLQAGEAYAAHADGGRVVVQAIDAGATFWIE
jgi:hypothetical protein